MSVNAGEAQAVYGWEDVTTQGYLTYRMLD